MVFWADLHNHNEVGYGVGRLKRSYDLASCLLDVYAFSPHTFWPDLPTNDPKTREKHERGFRKTAENWAALEETVRAYYRPDRLVTLLAWEWHSLRWGDYVMYFPGDTGAFTYAATLDELKLAADSAGALILPHHIGYSVGARGLDWDSLDPRLSPVVEVYSEHGSSFEPYSVRSMYGHSMGGVRRRQTALHQVASGRRVGFTGGTDHHDGYPGSYGLGLTAVRADRLTRQAVFEAIRARHVYAVTGDRIEADFRLADARFGDVTTQSAVGTEPLSLSVRGWAPLLAVEVLRNGRPETVLTQADLQQAASAGHHPAPMDEHILRIEWGWDGLGSTAVTRWEGEIRFDADAPVSVMPCFAGGPGSVEHTDTLTVDDDSVVFTSHTSRRNDQPVSGIAARWTGGPSASVTLRLEGATATGAFSINRRITKAELLENDVQVAVHDRFTAPKLKVHALVPTSQTDLEATLEADVQPGDTVMMRITQQNGQMAWVSPIWID